MSGYQPPMQPPLGMRTRAQYESKCPVCGERIEVGDEIVFIEDEGEWVHARHEDD